MLSPLTRPYNERFSQLEEDFVVSTRYGDITVPALFLYDGSSMPTFGQVLLNLTPFEPRIRAAALVHDYLYATHQLTKKQSDQVYYDLLIFNGVKKWKACVSYKGLWVGGGKSWKEGPIKLHYKTTYVNNENT